MKGLGKRVTVAFLSVVALLTVSGVISLFELSNLSADTGKVLTMSGSEMKVAKGLLSAAYNHNRAMIDVAILGDEAQKMACGKAAKALDSQITSARKGASAAVDASLDSLAKVAAQLQQLADGYSSVVKVKVAEATMGNGADSLGAKPAVKSAATAVVEVVEQPVDGKKWFKESYEPAYNHFLKLVDHYSTVAETELAPHTEQLSNNAYRSVMPVLISLAVMIAIVLMLYYFLYIYAVKPIVGINKALSDYLSFKLPYKTKVTMIDEVKSLNDNIEHLINASKSNLKQE